MLKQTVLPPSWTCVNLFSKAEVSAAFAELHDQQIFPWPDAHASTLSLSSTHALAPYASHRRCGTSGGAPVTGRDHIEIPLCRVLAATHHMSFSGLPCKRGPPTLVCSTSTRGLGGCLPEAVRHVLDALYAANVRFVEGQLAHASISSSARDDIWLDLHKRSVLRLLRYPSGTGCRPHVDPGLATALLMGSEGGLEVFEPDIAKTHGGNAAGDQTLAMQGDSRGDYSAMSVDGSNDVRALMGRWCRADALETTGGSHSVRGGAPQHDGLHHDSDGDGARGVALVLRGRMLDVLSHGTLPGVLHRVSPQWGRERVNAVSSKESTCTARYNIVVELRPANAKKLYAMAAEVGALTSTHRAHTP